MFVEELKYSYSTDFVFENMFKLFFCQAFLEICKFVMGFLQLLTVLRMICFYQRIESLPNLSLKCFIYNLVEPGCPVVLSAFEYSFYILTSAMTADSLAICLSTQCLYISFLLFQENYNV